jgi:hypothetical protein
MEASFLDRLGVRDARSIVGADQTVWIRLGKIGDALLLTVAIGFEAFGMLVGVILVACGDDWDDGILLVVIVW